MSFLSAYKKKYGVVLGFLGLVQVFKNMYWLDQGIAILGSA